MSRRGWVLFLAMGVIWGIPTCSSRSPSRSSLLPRSCSPALCSPWPFCCRSRQPTRKLRPLLPYWRPLLVYTVIEICIPWLLIGYAELDLSSSLTGMLDRRGSTRRSGPGAASPVTSRSRPGRVIGLLVGFAGVATLVGFDIGAASVGSVVALAVVAFCYAAARSSWPVPGRPARPRRRRRVAGGLGGHLPAGGRCAVAHRPVSTQAWLAVLALAVVCTAIAFIVFFRLIAEVGPHAPP